jgi:TetR/AcrR family transcriptional regulator, transcriptional repressor for nem operon
MKHFSEITASAERIVDAAESLIQAVGYNGFSYEDVARIVGIRKPSIHHHFPSKVDLVAIVAQRYTARFEAQLAEITESEKRAPNRLQAYSTLFVTTYAQDRRLCICGMLGAEADSLPPVVMDEVKHFFDVNLKWLSGVLKAGAAEGSLNLTQSADSMAELYLSALEGSMLIGRGRQSDKGPQNYAKTLLALLKV